MDDDAQKLADLQFLTWLTTEGGYEEVCVLPGRRYAVLFRFMFTWAILEGDIGDRLGYRDRWCYSSRDKALAALKDWDGHGEPTGWHRHPPSGRRRPEGVEDEEYQRW